VLGRGPLSDPTKETEDGDRYGIRPIASKQPEECTYGPTRTRAAVGEIPTEGAFYSPDLSYLIRRVKP
jgi:hypothetical protein